MIVNLVILYQQQHCNSSLQPCDWPVHHYFLLPADVRKTTLHIVLLVLSSTWEQ